MIHLCRNVSEPVDYSGDGPVTNNVAEIMAAKKAIEITKENGIKLY